VQFSGANYQDPQNQNPDLLIAPGNRVEALRQRPQDEPDLVGRVPDPLGARRVHRHGAEPAATVVPGYFKMRSRFVDYAGRYVIHCHILAHEDRGMMTIVQVVPFATAYSHK
jgi:hypothetical protein